MPMLGVHKNQQSDSAPVTFFSVQKDVPACYAVVVSVKFLGDIDDYQEDGREGP
jgi:hypothetical protein